MATPQSLEGLLGLKKAPVALTFRDSPPANLPRVKAAAPSGCTYWQLVAEAAHAAGVGADSGLMGRPTCAAIPAVLRSQHSAASLGCIGNRIYTGLADDEMYYALPGKHLAAVVDKLATIVNANRELEK